MHLLAALIPSNKIMYSKVCSCLVKASRFLGTNFLRSVNVVRSTDAWHTRIREYGRRTVD
jgi:hypothetical protein